LLRGGQVVLGRVERGLRFRLGIIPAGQVASGMLDFV